MDMPIWRVCVARVCGYGFAALDYETVRCISPLMRIMCLVVVDEKQFVADEAVRH